MALNDVLPKLKQAFAGAMKADAKEKTDSLPTAPARAVDELISHSSNSMLRALVGSVEVLGDFYFPADLIGGTCPRVPGEEEQIVWNAAAEACDTERVHVVWQAVGNRIWYLAVRSSDLAMHTDTWCPLAALLPTEKDVADLPICYTYFGEEIAVLMVAGVEELHIFRGTAPVVRAKTERTARELGNAKVVNIDLYRIGQLTPVPWYAASLFEDRARRILATVSVLASLTMLGISFVVWLLASMTSVAARHDMQQALDNTGRKTTELLKTAETLRASPMRDQIEKFLAINDGLLSLNGFLNVYEIKDGKPRWRATVPGSVTADRISGLGGKNIETTGQGVIIGNDAEIRYEEQKKR